MAVMVHELGMMVVEEAPVMEMMNGDEYDNSCSGGVRRGRDGSGGEVMVMVKVMAVW